MAAVPMTLDTDMKQTLVYYEDDRAGLLYHHRCLVVQGPGGKWIGITPTLEVQIVDLLDLADRATPLRRNARFPSWVPLDQVFAFDPFVGNKEQELRDECFEFAALVGFTKLQQAPAARLGVWMVADTALDLFGERVPEDAMVDPSLVVIKDRAGLVCIDGTWVPMQLVSEAGIDDWRMAKWTGAGRDPRIGGSRSDAQGRRYISEVDAMATWRPPKSVPRDHPLQGPSIILEYFEGLRVAGHTLVAHDQAWRSRSGVPESGPAARFHSALSDIMRYFVTVDQYDPTNSVAAEMALRCLVMIETACDRSPKQPDWDGLDVLVSSATTARGAIELQRFNIWVSTI